MAEQGFVVHNIFAHKRNFTIGSDPSPHMMHLPAIKRAIRQDFNINPAKREKSVPHLVLERLFHVHQHVGCGRLITIVGKVLSERCHSS